MFERARYFPREGYISMPWRNGAGTTREIARAPATGESFAWRLSLATLETSGPFSSYPGYHRVVALVDGDGFRLNTAGSAAMELTVPGDHALFQGAAETHCELLNGPCTDLSLMVREPGKIASVVRTRVAAEQLVSVPEGRIQAIFVMRGAVNCRAIEPSPPAAALRGQSYRLNVNDTLLIPGCGSVWSICPASSEITESLLLSFSQQDL